MFWEFLVFRHDPLVKFSANTLIFNFSFCTEHCLSSQAPRYSAIQGLVKEPLKTPQLLYTCTKTETLPRQLPVKAPAMDIQMIGADAFQFIIKCTRMQIFSLSVFAIDKAFNTKYSNSDIQISLDGKSTIDFLTKLPPKYQGYTDVFLVAKSNKLLSHRNYDYKIQLEPGKNPDHGPMHGMSRDELLVLKKYLEDNLCKELICASTSSTVSLVLFVKKPGGGLRFCVDY